MSFYQYISYAFNMALVSLYFTSSLVLYVIEKTTNDAIGTIISMICYIGLYNIPKGPEYSPYARGQGLWVRAILFLISVCYYLYIVRWVHVVTLNQSDINKAKSVMKDNNTDKVIRKLFSQLRIYKVEKFEEQVNDNGLFEKTQTNYKIYAMTTCSKSVIPVLLNPITQLSFAVKHGGSWMFFFIGIFFSKLLMDFLASSERQLRIKIYLLRYTRDTQEAVYRSGYNVLAAEVAKAKLKRKEAHDRLSVLPTRMKGWSIKNEFYAFAHEQQDNAQTRSLLDHLSNVAPIRPDYTLQRANYVQSEEDNLKKRIGRLYDPEEIEQRKQRPYSDHISEEQQRQGQRGRDLVMRSKKKVLKLQRELKALN